MSKVGYSPGADEVDMDEKPATSNSTTILFETPRPRWLCPVAIIIGVILCLVGLVCIIVALTTALPKPQCSSSKPTIKTPTGKCEFSKEAQRVDLEGFLEEARAKYFEMNPDNVAWQPGVLDMREHVKNRWVQIVKFAF